MFGLSLSKLIVLAAVIGAVWYGFKWLNRYNEMRKDEAERDRLDQKRRQAEADRASAAPAPARGGAEDMESCRACGTYVMARTARGCGRAECPYPG